MRQIDLTPFRRSAIGFDRLFDMLEATARQSGSENYPPFNLERISDDQYRITIAVAGFKPDEIEIMALVTRYHRRATPKDDHIGQQDLNKKNRRAVEVLSAFLRLAETLDRNGAFQALKPN